MKVGRIQGEIQTRVRAVFLKVRPLFSIGGVCQNN